MTMIAVLLAVGEARAEFLFAPSNPTSNGFMTPTLDYASSVYEYSAWDVFYAPHTAPNYPDKFAPYGGIEVSPGMWAPVTRTAAGFPAQAGYNPSNPLAFWDVRNPTITQRATSAFIIGPDVSGNIYTYSEKTSYELANSPDYGAGGLGTVVLQFQTDGAAVDFSSLKLVYGDGLGGEIEIAATDAEYLREYHTSGGGHWSATAGFANRVAVQWDLTGLTDINGDPISSYKLRWDASSTSMSLQKVDLVTADSYSAGIPISAAWTAGSGAWNNAGNWQLKENSGLTLPQANGNLRFQQRSDAVVTLGANHTAGEIIIESPHDLTINATGGATLTSNTGITTTYGATGEYAINAGYALGSLNFFEIAGGTVRMNGVVSGNYGLVKSGEGSLVLSNNNTFTGFLAVQGGTLRVEGTNAYSGATTIVNGRLVVAANAGASGALGNASSAILVGADADLYSYAGTQGWQAELMIDGDRTIGRDLQLAAGDVAKRLGSFNSTSGAIFAGTINFSGSSANPDSAEMASGNVKLTAQNASDRLIFSGAMTGGVAAKTVTLDGLGTVIYAGVNKTYANRTVVGSGRLQIEQGTSFLGSGDLSIASGASLRVHGTLAGSGVLGLSGTLEGSGMVGRKVTVGGGAVISPGAGLGKLTTSDEVWGDGGVYVWELGDASGGGGVGWDLLEMTRLSITATSNAPFQLRLISLADLANFAADAGYSWRIATTVGGISGFSVANFTIDTSGFEESLHGVFSLSQVGNDLFLNYAAVPEPSTWGLLTLAGGAGLFIAARRRRLAAAVTLKSHH